jgi:hypothetical protein
MPTVEIFIPIPCEAAHICHWGSCLDGGILGTLTKQPLTEKEVGHLYQLVEVPEHVVRGTDGVFARHAIQCDTPSHAETL